MYQGSVESVPQYFSDREHPIPPKYNPADWIMNVAQKYDFDRLERDGFFPKDNRVIGEAFVPSEGQDALGITIATRRSSTVSSDEAEDQYKPIDMAPPGFFLQTKLLFVREWQNLKRDTAAIGTRMGSTAFLSILVGAIFFEVGETDSSESFNLQSHFGALIMVLLMSMFGTAQPALISFPTERPVFLREYSTNHYSVVSYFMSRLTMEAIVTALQMLLMCMLSYFLVSSVHWGLLLLSTTTSATDIFRLLMKFVADWIANEFQHLVWRDIRPGHGIYCASRLAGSRSRKSRHGARNASHLVRPANAVCWYVQSSSSAEFRWRK